MKSYFFLFFVIFFAFACNNAGQQHPVKESLSIQAPPTATISGQELIHYQTLLSTFFDTKLLRNNQFNGGILIAKNGSILYEKYRGKIDLRKPDSIVATTPLHIASTSKTFTGIAILKLVQEHKIRLDDSLTTFFPLLPYRGITIRMLLNHRSGLPNYIHFMDKTSWDQHQYATNEDVLSLLIKEKPPVNYSPGKHFSYCNTNYLLLALIIEKITGKSYPEYMQEEYFDKLGMNNTYVFTLNDTLTATPSFNQNGNYWKYDFLDGTYGDKNIYSTPRDLLKWDQALYTDQLINQSLLDSAFSPYSLERPSIHNYGLGWRLQLLPNGKKIVYHFGKWHGFNAAFARLIDEKVTIIILGNRFTKSIYNTAHLSYDLFGNYFQGSSNDEDDTESGTIPDAKSILSRKAGKKQ